MKQKTPPSPPEVSRDGPRLTIVKVPFLTRQLGGFRAHLQAPLCQTLTLSRTCPVFPATEDDSDDGYSHHIRAHSCQISGARGTCMFVWECLKTEGKHLGMCMDGFMFGSCCVHDQDDDRHSATTSKAMPTFELKAAHPTPQPPPPPQTTEANFPSNAAAAAVRPTRPARPTKRPVRPVVKVPASKRPPSNIR